MMRYKIPFGLVLALGLVTAGCGDSTTSSAGGMGGMAGAGGAGGMGGAAGSGGGFNEDAQFVYEGDPLLLDTVNVCQIASDGTDSFFIAAIQSEEGAPNQVTFTLGIITEPTPGTGLFDTFTTQGSQMGLELDGFGQFDLVDFDPDIVQMIMGGSCTVDVVFNRTQMFGPTVAVDVYDVSFECPVLAYMWFNQATSMFTGSGTLTDLSGQFPCGMTTFQ